MVENSHFQQSSGCNSKINNLMGTIFKFVQDFIHVHLICKLQDDPITTGQVMLMIMSNIGFFNNQRDVTLRQIIQSGQVSNSSENLSMSALSAYFRKSQSNLKELC